MTTEPDPARARFFAIQFTRLGGAALVVLGLAIVARKIDLPPVAGVVIALAGLADFALFPLLLARRWRTPPE